MVLRANYKAGASKNTIPGGDDWDPEGMSPRCLFSAKCLGKISWQRVSREAGQHTGRDRRIRTKDASTQKIRRLRTKRPRERK